MSARSPMARLPLPTCKRADYSGLAQAPMHAKTGLLQQGGDDAARPFLFEPQLRMGMQVLAEAAQE